MRQSNYRSNINQQGQEGHIPLNYRTNIASSGLVRQSMDNGSLLAEKDRKINQQERKIRELEDRLRLDGKILPKVDLTMPILGSGLTLRQQVDSYVPQILIAGVSNSKANSPFLLHSELPNDIKLVPIMRDGKQSIKNKYDSILGCIIPIKRQLGRHFNGSRVFFSENLAIRDDQSGINVRQMSKLKQSSLPFSKMQDKLTQSTISEKIDGFLYIADDYEDRTKNPIDYIGLLNEKQNTIIELQKKIQNYENKLKTTDKRQMALQNQIANYLKQIENKAAIIELKERRLNEEIAQNNQLGEILNKIKSRAQSDRSTQQFLADVLRGLEIPSLNDVKSSTQKLLSSNSNFLGKTEVIKLMTELGKSANQRSQGMEIPQRTVEGWILGLPSSSQLRQKLQRGDERTNIQQQLTSMQDKLKYASTIYRQQIQKIKNDNPFVHLNINEQILNTLSSRSSNITRIDNVVQIEKNIVKTVQIPVQDVRTKSLITLLATQMKNMHTKYPKLYGEMDPRLTEYFSQEVLHVIESDQIDRLVEIVKYVPQIVKVQNVYAYSSDKSRKVEFHLRVLIKALLEQLQKVKVKSGITLQMDQGIVEMVRQQIIDVVDVDDILKVFQVNTKIVQVEKVVERIVERIVQVPKFIQTRTHTQKPVEFKTFQVLENVVHVPLQVPTITPIVQQVLVSVPRIVQKLIKVPRIIQKTVQLIKEIPKVITVDRMIEVPVQRQCIVALPEFIREIPVINQVAVEMIVQKIVTVQTVREVLKQTPAFIIEKAVPVRQQVIKTVEVPQYIDRVEYVPVPQVRNYIQTVYQQVFLETQRTIPAQVRIQEIVQVPQLVQKIVHTVEERQKLVSVEYTVQKPIYQDVIKQIQIETQHFLQKQVPKQIEVYRQVPIIQQVIRQIQVIIKQPVVETVVQTIHKQVKVDKPVILYQDKIIQVDKILNHFAIHQKPVFITQEQIIQLFRREERIKPVSLIRQKVIEKMVEVPKVVEVERIVQKIVVVPRVIEKIVEVPRIVQVPVQRIIEIQVIRQIQKIVHVPIIQEVFKEIEVPKYIYIQRQTPVQVPPQQILVTDVIDRTKVQIHEIYQQKIVVQTKQVVKNLEVEKLVVLNHQIAKIFQKPILVPIQIEVPVYLTVEKPVAIHKIVKQLVIEKQIVEKIVAVKHQVLKQIEVETKITELKIQPEYREIQKIVPYIQQKFVDRVVEKIIPVRHQVIKQVQVIRQKIVTLYETIEKAKIVERQVSKPIMTSKIVELQQIIPKIIQIPRYIQKLVEKIVEVPLLIERLKQIHTIQDKIVQVHTIQTEMMPVDRLIERQIIMEKLVNRTNEIHRIQQAIRYVEMKQRQQRQVPVIKQKFLEVPTVIEHIVQRIVLMPQIVEVLKYVHEVIEEQIMGPKVNQQIGTQQNKYKDLARNVKVQMEKLRSQLLKMKNNPALKGQVQIINNFLSQFQRFILYPRIHQIIKEKQVEKVIEKDRLVKLPTQGADSLTKGMLLQKLIVQLKRIQRQNPRIDFQLPDDIMNIFFIQDSRSSSRQILSEQLKRYSESVQRAFSSQGGWNRQQQQLLNEFLNERFKMAEIVRKSNMDSQKIKAISEKRRQQMSKYKEERDRLIELIRNLHQNINLLGSRDRSTDAQQQINNIIGNFFKIYLNERVQPKSFFIGATDFSGLRSHSVIRQKDLEIQKLKQIIRNMNTTEIRTIQRSTYKNRQTDVSGYLDKIQNLQREIERLRRIQYEHSKCKNRDNQERRLQAQIRILKQEIQSLQQQLAKANSQINMLSSPKFSRNTGPNSMNSPLDRKQDRKKQLGDKGSQSGGSNYGVNYQYYTVADDPDSVGIVGGREGEVNKSTRPAYQVTRSVYQPFNEPIQRSSHQVGKTPKANFPTYQSGYTVQSKSNKFSEGYRSRQSGSQEQEIQYGGAYGSNPSLPSGNQLGITSPKYRPVEGSKNSGTPQTGNQGNQQSGLSGSGSKIGDFKSKYQKLS